MYAIGLGPGDEIVCTSVTYWASCTGALALGAAVVFCDIDPETLQMDPASFEALNAEVGGGFSFGCNMPLHLSSVFFDVDVYGHGKPTSRVFLPDGVDPRAESGRLPNAERINMQVLGEPWCKHEDHAKIDPYVEAVRKVAANAEELRPINDTTPILGGIALSKRKK